MLTTLDWETFTNKASKKLQIYFRRFNLKKNILSLKFRNHFSDSSAIHITSSGIQDGGCAQLLRQLSTIAFIRSFGFSYIHTPLSEVQHNVNNDKDWTNRWESFFQLSNFVDTTEYKSKEFKVVEDLNELMSILIKRGHVNAPQYYQISDCHSYTNSHPSAYELIKKEFRESYDLTKRSPNLLYEEDVLNIAIHVRRGDVTKEMRPERFTSAKKLAKAIQEIENVLHSSDYKITLFCINEYEDLKELESNNVRLIHELDIFDVLDHLIHADVLVTSISTVSYISAIANEGIVIYDPFWHPPLRDWINMEEDFEQELKVKLTKMYPNKLVS